MKIKAKTVKEYLANLPDDRREALQAIRQVILKNLPKGYEEGMQYGMIGYYVPHSIYPDGYHCNPNEPLPFASLASQKNHMGLYLMCVYSDPEHQAWFRQAWTKAGKKLDMGKGCVRFKKLDDVPLAVVGQTIKRVPVKKYIERYEAIKPASARRSRNPTAKKVAAERVAAKNRVATKSGAKTSVAKKAAKKSSRKSTAKRSASS